MRILTLIWSTFVILGSNYAKPIDEDDDGRLMSNLTEDSSISGDDNSTKNRSSEVLLPVITTGASGSKHPVNRTAHARMSQLEDLFPRRRTTTSTEMPIEYDYWWRFTTPRRPRFSYRDFPGKPGVATWKEISPSVVNEGSNKKDHKTASPTAAEVLSGAPPTTLSFMASSSIALCVLLSLISCQW